MTDRVSRDTESATVALPPVSRLTRSAHSFHFSSFCSFTHLRAVASCASV